MPSTNSIYYTYILECSDQTYYIGKTNDLQNRLKQHNGILKGGAKYTRARKPVKLIYYEEYKNNKIATQREIELKTLTRRQKEKLINKI
jgi:putative endonuclease